MKKAFINPVLLSGGLAPDGDETESMIDTQSSSGQHEGGKSSFSAASFKYEDIDPFLQD